MTLFENNLDVHQAGFFDVERKPADADLTWIKPNMIKWTSHSQTGDITFWFHTVDGIYLPYVTVLSDDDIVASDMGLVPGHEDLPRALQSMNRDRGFLIHNANGIATKSMLGTNIMLPKWMLYKVKAMRRGYDAV